jgi:hypothetical protein
MSKETKEVTLNDEQGLYVIPCGKGYTCLGYDVCLERSERLLDWLYRHTGLADYGGLRPYLKRGTMEAYATYQALMIAAHQTCALNGVKCDVELTAELNGLEHKRVEVVDCHGHKRRFIVGKSTGWMPIHLEIARRNSSGGMAATGAPYQSIRVIT